MKQSVKTVAIWSLSALTLANLAVPTAWAASPWDNSRTSVGGYFQQHPVVKKAAIGAGIGAVIGGLVARDNRMGGAVKGAVLGGLAGTGLGYAQSRGYLGGQRNTSSNFLPSSLASYSNSGGNNPGGYLY